MAQEHTGSVAPLPGPVDREDFRDAQRRRRRESWRMTAITAVTVAVMGIPLSAVVSPLLYAAGVLAVDVANLVVDTPDPLRFLAEGEDPFETPSRYAAIGVALVLPGSLALLAGWIGVRRVFGRSGAGAALLALGAREPRLDVLEELQLTRVVEEVAVAAGLPAPGVRLIDTGVANAAVVGTGADDATVVVTTGLLGLLDRDETQAVVAHLVGSAGNGDLRIGTTIASMYQTLGLFSTLLRAPSEQAPRRTLRALLGFACRRRSAADLTAAADLLVRAGGEWETEPDSGTPRAGWRDVVLLPFFVAGSAFALTNGLFSWILVAPFLGGAWKARRLLGDATAVALTRNPDALARALGKLGEHGDLPPGGEWHGHLFVVGRAAGARQDDPQVVRFHPSLAKRADRLLAMGARTAPPRVAPRGLGQQLALVAVVVLASPCIALFFGLLLGAVLTITYVSIVIDLLFLFPVVVLLHLALRALAR